MLSRLDPKSHDVIVDDLDFSTMPGTQTCIQNSRWVIVNLKNTFLPNGPWEFVLTNNSRSYLNLKRTWLIFTFKITDEAGNPIVHNKDTPTYAPIQNIAHSIVKNFTLHINSQLVYHNSSNYAYKSYLETTLLHDGAQKNSTLTASGYSYDPFIGNKDSAGYKTRCSWVAGGKTYQVAANISIDLMNQPRVLMNSCNVKLTAYPNSSEFLIESYNKTPSTTRYKFQITDVYAMVNEFDLTDGLTNELEAAVIQHQVLQYPLISGQVRSFYIEPNRLDAPANTLFTSKMPRRLFLGLVSAEAYNGSYHTSPFDFRPYSLTDVHIDYCGITLPGRPMNLDFTKNKHVEAFVQLQESLGHCRSNMTCNSIDMLMFKEQGFTIFGFEMSPIAQDSSLFELVRQTNVSVRLNFKDPTPAGGLYCIVYAEFDQIIAFDHMRNPIIDTIV